MKVFSLFFVLIFALAYAGISCVPPGSQLGSEGDNNNDDDKDRDDDDGDRTRTRECSSRDSCQDICDDMFNYTSEHSRCYDLSYDEVNTISKVWDEFSRGLVRSDELEDLKPEDVRAYFEIGFESFIDLVKGEEVGDSAKDDNTAQWSSIATISNNSRKIMKWVAEEDNIAEVFLEQDRNFELGLELFQAINGATYALVPTSGNPSFFSDATWRYIQAVGGDYICFDVGFRRNDGNPDIRVIKYYNDATENCNSPSKQLNLRFNGVSKFLSGFLVGSHANSQKISEFSDESFMTFAAGERNEKAFEWGHKTLLEFCKEATDEDEEDVDVKTCLQTVYCMHRRINTNGTTREGIFEDLEDHEDIVGRTDEKYCADLADEDRMEDLFD